MTPEQKTAIIAHVACPHCKADVGEPCRKPNGYVTQYMQLHVARRDAAFAVGVYVAS